MPDNTAPSLKSMLVSRLLSLSRLSNFIPPGWEIWFVGDTVDSGVGAAIADAFGLEARFTLPRLVINTEQKLYEEHYAGVWAKEIGESSEGLPFQACPGLILFSCSRGITTLKARCTELENLMNTLPSNDVYAPSIIIMFVVERGAKEAEEPDIIDKIRRGLQLHKRRPYFLDITVTLISRDNVISRLATAIDKIKFQPIPQPTSHRPVKDLLLAIFSAADTHFEHFCNTSDPCSSPARQLSSLRYGIAVLNQIPLLLESVAAPIPGKTSPHMPQISRLEANAEYADVYFHLSAYLSTLRSTSKFPSIEHIYPEIFRKASIEANLPTYRIYNSLAFDLELSLRPTVLLRYGYETMASNRLVLDQFCDLLSDVECEYQSEYKDELLDPFSSALCNESKRQRTGSGEDDNGKQDSAPHKRGRHGQAETNSFVAERSALRLQRMFNNVHQNLLAGPGLQLL